MIDYTALLEFSRNHCVAICAFLVPANLLTTLTTLIFTGLGRSSRQILVAAGTASLLAGIMVLHVMTWFLIGVVMMPTFILLGLGGVCGATNLWAILNRRSLERSLAVISRIWVYIRFALFSQLT